MLEIKLASGKAIQFEEFIPKEKNLIKVRLHDNGVNGEGIWACLRDEDMEDYQNGVTDSEPIRLATLRNAPLNYYPDNNWGMVIPVRFDGEMRPEFDINWLDEEAPIVKIMTETQS